VTNSLAVGSLDDLTTEWATAAIGTGDATATSVTLAGVVTGSNIKARLALEWTGSDAAHLSSNGLSTPSGRPGGNVAGSDHTPITDGEPPYRTVLSRSIS
jgi:hypothetical protein